MRSSSTEPRRTFLPVGAGAWARLALVVILGAGALTGPQIGRTGALYTDVETVGIDAWAEPAPPPDEAAGDGANAPQDGTPTPDPTETASVPAEPPADSSSPDTTTRTTPAPGPVLGPPPGDAGPWWPRPVPGWPRHRDR